MEGAKSKCQGLQLVRAKCSDNKVVWQLLKYAGTWAAEALLLSLLGYLVPARLATTASYVFKARDLMKAPGKKGEFILREAFERDPRAYFRNLRSRGL